MKITHEMLIELADKYEDILKSGKTDKIIMNATAKLNGLLYLLDKYKFNNTVSEFIENNYNWYLNNYKRYV